VDIPVARHYGAWDTLHDLPDGAALSNAIKQAATVHHGLAGCAYLERLTRDKRNWSAYLEDTKALPIFTQATEGQEKRVAARFALYGIAGELATEYGLTGWPIGDALKAAGEGFRLWLSERGRWLSERGRGNDEQRQIVEQVSDFINQYGDGRFTCVNAEKQDIPNRAGWWCNTDSSKTYLFTSDGLRNQALKGFDFKRALDVLQAAGVLQAPESGGERARPMRIQGRVVKVYPIEIRRNAGVSLDRALALLKNDVTEVTGVTANNGAGYSVTPANRSGVAGVTDGREGVTSVTSCSPAHVTRKPASLLAVTAVTPENKGDREQTQQDAASLLDALEAPATACS